MMDSVRTVYVEYTIAIVRRKGIRSYVHNCPGGACSQQNPAWTGLVKVSCRTLARCRTVTPLEGIKGGVWARLYIPDTRSEYLDDPNPCPLSVSHTLCLLGPCGPCATVRQLLLGFPLRPCVQGLHLRGAARSGPHCRLLGERERLGISGGAFSPRGAAHGPRISRRGGGGQSPHKR